MNLKNIIRILLGIATIILAYFIFESIMEPQRYETLRAQREVEVVNRLRDIRTVQVAHRHATGRFISTLDSLVMFLEHGQLPTIRRTGYIPEDMTEVEALRLGLITRDTIFTNAHATLFPHREDKAVHLANLRYIPFTNRTVEFTMETGFVTRSHIEVPVIEVSAPWKAFMSEPRWRQIVANNSQRAIDINRFPGRRFGSMTEPILEGNWE